ncbi:MAG: dATP/dGTP diphosphohydrolase domain-containing protein [Solirubrobacterales bacterium]
MSGVPEHNFPAFREATADLRERGIEVVSPHELDDPAAVAEIDPDAVSAEQWQAFLARDLKVVCDVDAVVVLGGWERSRGANLEVSVARELGKPILRYPDLWPIDGEERVTDPDTGGQKGQKLERFDLIPADAHAELARVYGKGARKYDDDNWRRGYRWRLSAGAMERHLNAWKRGESIDPETGCNHLIMSAWHCFTLYTFEAEGLGTDDLPERR